MTFLPASPAEAALARLNRLGPGAPSPPPAPRRSSMKYHSHARRDEVWTIIAGSGRSIIDGMEQRVRPGDVIGIAAGCRHTLLADTELKVIEVQLGREISADDKQIYEL